LLHYFIFYKLLDLLDLSCNILSDDDKGCGL